MSWSVHSISVERVIVRWRYCTSQSTMTFPSKLKHDIDGKSQRASNVAWNPHEQPALLQVFHHILIVLQQLLYRNDQERANHLVLDIWYNVELFDQSCDAEDVVVNEIVHQRLVAPWHYPPDTTASVCSIASTRLKNPTLMKLENPEPLPSDLLAAALKAWNCYGVT